MTSFPLPPIAGREAAIQALMQAGEPWPVSDPAAAAPPERRPRASIRSAFACALHMHQPTIPAGASGELISHLQYMLEHPGEGDNHNAEPFAHCYRRLAEILPRLIAEGCDPRIMLDYSGNLLWGFQQMGRTDILDSLTQLTCDPALQPHVEWLGTFWSHAVAPSTPIPDLKLQIQAWQHHFASLFGDAALRRVKGFSLPEMALPNHPDTLHALVQALRDCGYQWLLVQEHSVENPDGRGLDHGQRTLPQALVARSASGEVATITALIKTQGSDTKLVGQMQPYYEALGWGRQELGGVEVPSLVAQIADGENGGVMMNEFPSAFEQAHRRIASGGGDGGGVGGGDSAEGGTVALNGSEYLELLEACGVHRDALSPIQAAGQHRLWQWVGEDPTAQTVEAAIAAIQAVDPSFQMAGASWTNNLSWVEGYANVLEPMNQLSALFHQHFDPLVARDPACTQSPVVQEALLYLLLLETSCFRYWGQGTWTAYAREIHRRGVAAIEAMAAGSGPA
jgi:hypothetical protein